MAEDARIPVPVSSITFVLRGRGKKRVLKLRSVVYRPRKDEERNVWGIWRGIVAALESRDERKELPVTLQNADEILELYVRPGKEETDVKRYMHRMFGNVHVNVRPAPRGYHVTVHVPETHPAVKDLVRLVEKEGQPSITYGVHALMNPRASPVTWVPYIVKRFETLDTTAYDLLKYARDTYEAGLALKRMAKTVHVLERVLKHVKQARNIVEKQGTGAAIRYLRHIRDRMLKLEEDHILALLLDDVIRLITKHPRPERGIYPQKERSRKWALLVLEREIRRLALVKNNMVEFLEKSGGGT